MITDEGVLNDPASDELYAAVYHELKRLAHRQLLARSGADTLSTTELVHEAFLKLGRRPGARWQNRAHFFGAAATAMRDVLVDFGRRRQASKRGGSWRVVSLELADQGLDVDVEDLLALDAALDQLDALDPRLRRVVELRFFAGLAEDDIAQMLGVSTRTVERDWRKARMFLLRAMETARA